MKDVAVENPSLKKENAKKDARIAALENKLKQFEAEKIDMINSIEFNADAIKKIEECQTTKMEEKLKDSDASFKKFKDTINSLEDKIDDTEQYERWDTVILSGAVPIVTPNEDIRKVTVDLINSKYWNFDVKPSDISVCHRLQVKSRSSNGSQKPPNICKICS